MSFFLAVGVVGDDVLLVLFAEVDAGVKFPPDVDKERNGASAPPCCEGILGNMMEHPGSELGQCAVAGDGRVTVGESAEDVDTVNIHVKNGAKVAILDVILDCQGMGGGNNCCGDGEDLDGGAGGKGSGDDDLGGYAAGLGSGLGLCDILEVGPLCALLVLPSSLARAWKV